MGLRTQPLSPFATTAPPAGRSRPNPSPFPPIPPLPHTPTHTMFLIRAVIVRNRERTFEKTNSDQMQRWDVMELENERLWPLREENCAGCK